MQLAQYISVHIDIDLPVQACRKQELLHPQWLQHPLKVALYALLEYRIGSYT